MTDVPVPMWYVVGGVALLLLLSMLAALEQRCARCGHRRVWHSRGSMGHCTHGICGCEGFHR